jgi:C1A family cysteine protease
MAKINVSPSWKAMRKAYAHKIDGFYKIRSIGQRRVDEVANCLQAGYPVVFGTTTGNNWNRYRAGQVLERPESKKGRHATCLVGIEDGKFIGENSWGTRWGDDGFYLMDPAVIGHDDSKDFWVARAGYEEVV